MPCGLVSYSIEEQEGSGLEVFWQGCVCFCLWTRSRQAWRQQSRYEAIWA